MDLYTYLVEKCHWHVTRTTTSGVSWGCCPFHNERTPSFHERDGHCRCEGTGCGAGGDIIRIIKFHEFPYLGEDSKTWGPVYRRARELGVPLEEETTRPKQSVYQDSNPFATVEQQGLIECLRRWSHMIITAKGYGRPARIWLQDQGISTDAITPEIGYMPFMNDHFASSLTNYLGSQFGVQGWQQIARSIRLIGEGASEDFRLHNRVLFFCRSTEGTHNVVFYTARSILRPKEGKPYYPYMNAYSIKKYPFTLSTLSSTTRGTILVESPKGVALLATYGIRAAATCGEGLDFALLGTLPPPLWLFMDADTLHFRSDGTTYRPGDLMAKRIRAFCTHAGIEAYIPTPGIPPVYKDMDTWVASEGIRPLLEQLEQLEATTQERAVVAVATKDEQWASCIL